MNYISEEILNLNDLAPEMKIDVMSATCNIGTKFNATNIHQYIDLSSDCIISSQLGNNLRYVELIEGKKYKKAFSNQLTLIVKINVRKYLNVKLFVNGSIQITGGEKVDDYNILFSKLFSKLSVEKSIIVDDEIIKKPFLEEPEKLCINGFKINMINSGCCVNYMINRDTLFKILTTNEKIGATYEPMMHAGVSVPYIIDNVKKASIFVFESGKIIITGVKNVKDINGAYKFISELLEKWKQTIIKKETKNIDDIIAELKKQKGIPDLPVYSGKPRGRKKKIVSEKETSKTEKKKIYEVASM
jgi:TATA-box binding protein (TBP) (component of TFIID and TFIIIB)